MKDEIRGREAGVLALQAQSAGSKERYRELEVDYSFLPPEEQGGVGTIGMKVRRRQMTIVASAGGSSSRMNQNRYDIDQAYRAARDLGCDIERPLPHATKMLLVFGGLALAGAGGAVLAVRGRR